MSPEANHFPAPPAGPDGLGDLFQEHHARLLAVVRRRLDPALAALIDAEDVLQDAFLRASDRWAAHQERPGCTPYAWLYRITRDCLIDAWRRQRSDRRDVGRNMPWPDASSAQLGLGLVGSATSPSSAAARDELCRRIRELLDLLGPQDREILWLRHYDGLTYPEAADVMGINTSAATLRYVRALERLRKLWRQLYPKDEVGRGAPSTPSEDEVVLAQLLLDRERYGDVIVLEYLDRHPHLAERIRSLLRLGSVIERSRPADEAPLPARLEDFRIVRRAGGGGMGEVYEAVQERLQRRVAVKVIRRGQDSPEARARFWREGLAQALLHHTHILPIYAAGEQDGLPFLVMPFVEGASLHAVVAAARDLPAAGPRSVPPLKELAELAGRKPAAAGKAAGGDGAPQDEPDRGPELETNAPGGTGPGPSPGAPRKGGASPRLSPAYFRSVAALLADAADAVQHAHEARVVHRDLKPSNLLVDADGQCWVIDFGLAGFLGGGPAPVMPAGGEAPSPEPLTVGQTLGTPGYMAPEQLRGLADARTDVWGLGVTLYELLTLRPAFTGLTRAEVDQKVRSGAPARPNSLVGNVPPDLEAVCLKALRKDPGERYPSARELRDDLRRWLAGEPTRARGAWPLRRAALWARRNKGWAAALAFGLLAVLTAAGAAVGLAEAEKNRAGKRAQERRRETIRLQLLNLRLMPHLAGWSDRAWRLVEEAASLPGEDDLRDQAAATLIGFDFDIDPRVPARFPAKFPASSVAFDAKGRRLLTGGLDGKPAHLWERADPPPKASRRVGPGPVAFDGETPLQLIVDTEDPNRVLLWDVARQRRVRTFPMPGPSRAANDPEAGPPLLYMTAGGELIAIATSTGNDKGQMAVWDARAGKQFGTFDGRATALAVSPDGAWLASGAENGEITLHSLATRIAEPLPHLGRTRIQCLAFHRDVRRAKGADGRRQNWLLASGDAGGTTVVWDVGARTHRGVYRGSLHGVGAVAFSPDNMTLATGGLNDVRLWDLASGKVLLRREGFNWSTGLTFSSDGGKLACLHQENFPPARTEARVWQLEVGRGVRSLRGLTGQVSKVALSADGRYLAALSHDWQVGVWDLNSTRLLHTLDVPPSMFTADNAALAFSADGDHLAFAAGKNALQWEVATAREEGDWDLPEGYVDAMSFGSGSLRLVRMETKDGKWGDRAAHPRVLRLRELQTGCLPKEVKVIDDFNWHLFKALMTPDGSTFVVEGRGGPGGTRRRIAAFDGATGSVKWSRDLKKTNRSAGFASDPAGAQLGFTLTDDDNRWALVELGTAHNLLDENWMRVVMGWTDPVRAGPTP